MNWRKIDITHIAHRFLCLLSTNNFYKREASKPWLGLKSNYFRVLQTVFYDHVKVMPFMVKSWVMWILDSDTVESH